MVLSLISVAGLSDVFDTSQSSHVERGRDTAVCHRGHFSQKCGRIKRMGRLITLLRLYDRVELLVVRVKGFKCELICLLRWFDECLRHATLVKF